MAQGNNPNASLIQSTHKAETRRTLPLQQYTADGRPIVFDIPLDTAIKRADCRVYGAFEVTYASGSPVADNAGFAGRILSRIDVVANGGDTVKSVDPYVMRLQQLLLNGIAPSRSNATSASAPTSYLGQNEVKSGAAFAYPPTTNYVVINEAFSIHFEHPWAHKSGGRSTLLYTKTMASCQMIMQVGALSNLQNYAGGSPVSITYSNTNLFFEVQLIENQWVNEDPKAPFYYFRELTKHAYFSGQTADGLIDLNRGGLLTGIHFLVRNGDANKSLSDIAVTRIRLKANSSVLLADSTFLGLQESIKGRYGVDAAKSSGNHALQGYAFLNLMTGGFIESGLDTSMLQQLQLDVDTASSAASVDPASYTNPVDLEIMTQDVIRPSGK